MSQHHLPPAQTYSHHRSPGTHLYNSLLYYRNTYDLLAGDVIRGNPITNPDAEQQRPLKQLWPPFAGPQTLGSVGTESDPVHIPKADWQPDPQ